MRGWGAGSVGGEGGGGGRGGEGRVSNGDDIKGLDMNDGWSRRRSGTWDEWVGGGEPGGGGGGGVLTR